MRDSCPMGRLRTVLLKGCGWTAGSASASRKGTSILGAQGQVDVGQHLMRKLLSSFFSVASLDLRAGASDPHT